MLKQVTSLFDYFKKAEASKEYQLVGLYSYIEDGYNPAPYIFDSVKAWIEKWVKDTVGNGYEQTCQGMVDYLNRTIKRMDDPGHAARLKQKLETAIASYEAEQASYRVEKEKIERAIQQAQATGQPVITAQQTPIPQMPHIDWTQIVTNTPIIQRTNWTINPAYYGTVTIDNTIRQTPNTINPPPTPAEPQATTPQPPIENLWPNFIGEVPAGHPDNPTGQTPPAPNVTPRPGDMTEYGWYDQEIENEIETLVHQQNLNREDAIVRVFNNAGPDHILRNPPPPTPPAANEPQWVDLGEDFNLDDYVIDYTEDDPREER